MKEFRHKCELRLLVCEPNPLRPDRVTVGFVLRDTSGDSPRVEVRFAPDLSALQCLHPDVDLEAIEGTLLELEPILKNVTDFERYLQNMPADFPVDFGLLSGTALLTDSIEQELILLEGQYFSVAPNPDSLRLGAKRELHRLGRAFILRRMQQSFRDSGVWNFIDKGVSLDDYTFKGDPLQIDFGWASQKTNTYRMLHAVSLMSNLDRPKILALSWPLIRDGFEKQQHRQCEMVAIVEDMAKAVGEREHDARQWMQNAGIAVQPVSAMPQIAAEARSALAL